MAAMIEVLSTDALPPRERAPLWAEWMSRQFGGVRAVCDDDAVFGGRLALSRAGDVVFSRMEATGHRVHRTASTPRTSDRAYLKILAPWRGRATVRQLGREASAREGEWVIYDTAASFDVVNPEPVDHLMVMIPRDALASGGRRIEAAMARGFGAGGISRVALDAMRNSWLELPNMGDAAAEGAGQLIAQLVDLSLMELAGDETALTQREALRDRIRAYIQRNLRDPALNADGIARALHCSRRHLYNAFEGEGEAIAACILRLRVEACVRDLQASAARERSITDIALSWGFSNLSHFSRVVRERTGRSPTEFRAQASRPAGTGIGTSGQDAHRRRT